MQIKIKELELRNHSLVNTYGEVREMINNLENKNRKIENYKILNCNNNLNENYKNLNNYNNISQFSKTMNKSREDIYNNSMNYSVNNGNYKYINDFKNVIYLIKF